MAIIKTKNAPVSWRSASINFSRLLCLCRQLTKIHPISSVFILWRIDYTAFAEALVKFGPTNIE